MKADTSIIFTLIMIFIFSFYVQFKAKRKWGLFTRRRKISFHEKSILNQRVDYYKKLTPEYKSKFERRLVAFIESKEFISRSSVRVNDSMKVLISASAVQICFGLPDVVLETFTKILIYPTDYYSTLRRQYHKGETNAGFGLIVLSWKDFEAGINNPSDGLNLGIHEMAHALELENKIYNEEYDFLSAEILTRWDRLVKREIADFENGKVPIFREYGYTNSSEFFAVSVEHFFEKPENFLKNSPQLFETMGLLLNQDILQIYENKY